MKKFAVDLFLYRWRYIIGYSVLIIIFVLALTFAGLYAPGGLTQAEIDTLGLTNQLSLKNPESFAIPNLPLHLLQRLSLNLLGVSVFTVKLPAILLAIVTAIALFFLIRRWFKPNVAILAMLIMTITGQFMFVAQNATSQILYITYAALILLMASLVTQHAKHQLLWKIGLVLTVFLSFFTPYFLYINFGILLVALIHPHTRYQITRKSERKNWLIAGGIFLALIIGFVVIISKSPSLFTTLLGYQLFNWDIVDNIKALLRTYFWISPVVHFGQIVPIMDFSSLALIALGVLATIKQRYTARTYIVAAWLLFAVPLLLVRPQLTILIVVPLFILLAAGIETLLSEWYGLFPKNPYARTAGLVMLVALISVMILSGTDRFFNGYRYTPAAVHSSNTDLTTFKHYLQNQPDQSIKLLSTESERPIYQALARQYSQLTVLDNFDTDSKEEITLTQAARADIDTSKLSVQKILTNDLADDADRFYFYKPISK